MLTRYALLNFLITVAIGSVLMGVGIFVYEGGDEWESLLFAAPMAIVAAILGAPTTIAQIIAVNVRRELPLTRRLVRSNTVGIIGGVVTFGIMMASVVVNGEDEVTLFITGTLLSYGIGGLIINMVRCRRFKEKHHMEQLKETEVLDFEFDSI